MCLHGSMDRAMVSRAASCKFITRKYRQTVMPMSLLCISTGVRHSLYIFYGWWIPTGVFLHCRENEKTCKSKICLSADVRIRTGVLNKMDIVKLPLNDNSRKLHRWVLPITYDVYGGIDLVQKLALLPLLSCTVSWVPCPYFHSSI